MRSVFVAVVVAFIVGACDSGGRATPSDADCGAAASAIVRSVSRESSRNAVIQLRCVEDRWSLAAVRCLRSAPNARAIADCRRQHLTVIQDEKLGEIAIDGSGEEAMVVMSRFRDDMCQCRDAKCPQTVSNSMTAWWQEHPGRIKQTFKMSERDQKRATEIGIAMGECMQSD